MRRATFIAALGLLLVSCGVSRREGSDRTHVITRAWPAAEVQALDLRGTNGKVTVDAGAVDKVTMVARVKSFRRRDAAEAAQIVKSRLEDGTLYITEKRSRRDRMIFLPFGDDDYGVSYTLTVPAKLDLALTNVNGSIDVAGVEGVCELRSVNGSIEARLLSGELTARTVNGRVRANFERDFRGARIKTVNGSIAVSLPENASFDCDISQVNGSFKSNVPLSMRVENDHQRGTEITEEVNGGKYPLDLSTVNGTVTVKQKQIVVTQ